MPVGGRRAAEVVIGVFAPDLLATISVREGATGAEVEAIVQAALQEVLRAIGMV